jgi:hypothetical protein
MVHGVTRLDRGYSRARGGAQQGLMLVCEQISMCMFTFRMERLDIAAGVRLSGGSKYLLT